MRPLLLMEEFHLLAHSATTGERLASEQANSFAARGALMLDLIDHGLARVEDGRLLPTTATTADDATPLVAGLQMVRGARRPRKIKRLIVKGPWALRSPFSLSAASLQRLAIVTERRERVLRLFTRSRWPATDPATVSALRERVRAAVVGEVTPDARTALLAALLEPLGLLTVIVDRDELADATRRTIGFIASDETGITAATRRAVLDAEAAILASRAAGGGGGP